MRPGRIARGCLSIIDRYQRSRGAKIYDKRCRFEPSCCTFMGEAFRTRSFFVAFLLAAGRLLRCNPLTRPGAKDPVHRAHLRPRPNTIRSLSVAAMLAGMVVVAWASVAGAQTTNGCTAFVRGRATNTMTKSDPLIVHKGEQLAVQGTRPGGPGDTWTHIEVYIVRPVLGMSLVDFQHGSGTSWGGTANPETYLKQGSGLYSVRAGASWGVNVAPGSAQDESQTCSAEFYVKFDGGRTIELVAGGLTLIGAGGTAASGSRKKGVTLDDLGKTLDDDIKKEVPGIDTPSTPEPKVDVEARYGAFTMCCTVSMLLAPVSAILGTMGSAGGPAGSAGEVLYSKTHWKRGHPILGFIFGLLFGIGGTIVLQQEGIWTLDIWTGIVLPVGFAILGVIRGLIGRPFRVTVTR